jgi:hypothetical protein
MDALLCKRACERSFVAIGRLRNSGRKSSKASGLAA